MTRNTDTNILRSALFGTTLALALIGHAEAAQSIFLKVPGIVGPSTDDRHRGEIPVLGFSTSASVTTAGAVIGIGSGGGAVKASCGQFTVVKQIDQTSPVFLGDLYKGTHIANATISFATVARQPYDYYKIDLFDVLVIKIAQTDPQNDTNITETMTLAATRYKFSYTPQKPDGSLDATVSFGWDCSRNASF